MPPRKSDGTPKEKRQLVRWDADHDIMLLLTVQQVCNAQGIKLPWSEIANVMGEKFSEGAIIQHLAKVRLRRQNEGKQVPPPLRRSVASSGGCGGSRVVSPTMLTKPKPNLRKLKKRKVSSDTEDYEEGTLADSSDEEDPSYTQGFQTRERHVKKRSKALVGPKHRNTAGQYDHMIDASSSSSDFEIVNGSGSGPYDDDDQENEHSSQQSPKDSKILRLNVPRSALGRLQNTGSVMAQTSSDAIQSSPPSWPHHVAAPHEHFTAATYSPGYGTLASTVGHHDVYSGLPLGQLSQYPQPGNYGFINPPALNPPALSRPPTEWGQQAAYPNQYPIPHMPANSQEWAQHHSSDPSWEATKQEEDEA